MSDERTPGRRLWDRIQGSEATDASHYFTMANPAVKADYERVGAEVAELEAENAELRARLAASEPTEREKQLEAALSEIARWRPFTSSASPDETTQRMASDALAARSGSEAPDAV